MLPLLNGCATSGATDNGLSPTAIVVRNNSGSDFVSASLSALPDEQQRSRAFGELAPIPDRIEQVYGRPSRAAPLPAEVEFRLQTLQGQMISRRFRLDDMAQQAATLSAPYVLVFVLEPGGQIRSQLEPQ